MDKVRHPTAPDGRFVEGNPITGIVPTRLTAEHLNAEQEELVNAIKAGGLTPSHDDNTQLAKAIRSITIAEQGNYAVRIGILTAADILSPDEADDDNALFLLERLPDAPLDDGITTTPI
jgi:hypothetical protein